MGKALLSYQIATYTGTVEVNCNDDDDNDVIFAKASAQLRRKAGGTLPIGYQSFRVLERFYDDYEEPMMNDEEELE